ncbi:hypothetical protein [Sphingomonas sp. S2-65]|uniref:hypothetical protein n=1 Tax=Sphingomonas sp. S2-65 TaxID=2903960 RepID=UPI001F33AA49|nr:hypothetical protein [Sphingomonas sp. S2-65]UYY57424.1 hypothetical protein LZ586_12155 [Sphingomonas sp. S2-65]
MMAALGAGGLLATGCELVGLQWRYRYRLTVSLVRGADTRSGSGVIEIVRSKGYTGIGANINGEAIVVDLPGEKPLFTLLSSEIWGTAWPSIMPHYALSKQLGTVDMVNAKVLDELVRMIGAEVVLDAKIYPHFAMFRDLQEPSTVQQVNSGDPEDGTQGYSIDKIALKIVDADITQNIYNVIPWLKEQRGALTKPDLKTPLSNRPFSAWINEASFIQGSIK